MTGFSMFGFRESQSQDVEKYRTEDELIHIGLPQDLISIVQNGLVVS
jgi:hypothetical protein